MKAERVKARIDANRAHVVELRARWVHGDENAGHEADQLELELGHIEAMLAAHVAAEAARTADPAALRRAVTAKLEQRDVERAEQASAREVFERRMRGDVVPAEAAPEEGTDGKQLAVGRPGTDPAGDSE